MARKKQFAVIGLGRFGETVALELVRMGHEVLGIDLDDARVERMVDVLTRVVKADTTIEEVLQKLGVKHFDAVLVAIGQNIEASILTTQVMVTLTTPATPGVSDIDESASKEVVAKKSEGKKRCKIWVKARTKTHAQILRKLGQVNVIQPEFERGLSLARTLDRPELLDYIPLGDGWTIVKTEVRPPMFGENISTFISRSDGKAEVLALQQEGELICHPSNERVLHEGDQLVLMGRVDDLKNMSDSML